MKKLLLTILTILCLKSEAQLASGYVSIVNTSTSYVCCDDSIIINFTFHFSGNPDTTQKWQFLLARDPFIFYPLSGPMKYTEFYSLPHQLVGSDTIYSLKVRIPCEFVDLKGEGETRVWITSESQYPIFIADCRAGIEEYWLSPKFPSAYYDFMGNVIEPKPGQLMIQRSGNRARKVRIND